MKIIALTADEWLRRGEFTEEEIQNALMAAIQSDKPRVYLGRRDGSDCYLVTSRPKIHA